MMARLRRWWWLNGSPALVMLAALLAFFWLGYWLSGVKP